MKPGIRYRFSEGGKTTDAKPEHAERMQVAHTLLNEVIQHATIFGLEQFRRTITLSDKTSITASVNVGFGEVKIDTPPPPPPPPEESPKESAQQDKPPPEEEEEEEEEEEDGYDYLWIGIRPVQPINSEAAGLDGAYSVCGLLIEPDGVHTLLGDAGYDEMNGWMNDSSGPISDPNSFLYDHLKDYHEADNPYFQVAKTLPVGYEPLGVAYRDGPVVGGVRFSPGGVIGYDVVINAYVVSGDQHKSLNGSMMPIDPRAPMTEAAYPEGQFASPGNPDAWWGDPQWHNVFLLDPNPTLIPNGNFPLRTQDTQIRSVVSQTLKTLYGSKIRAKTGKYTLKVLMYGDCRYNKGAPIDVEIEVRVGKPYQKTKTEYVPQTVYKTTETINWWSRHSKAVIPYGGVYQGTVLDGEPNPHGPMWWQGGLSIDLKSRVVGREEYLVPDVNIGMSVPMFGAESWPGDNDKCSAIVWYPYMLSSFYPGSVPIGETLEAQAHNFARTFYYATWYGGDQGWDHSSIDWSRYNLAPIEAAIAAYAASAGRTNLNGTKIIASGYPADIGTRPDPVITITEISTTSSDEWTTLVNSGQIYNGTYHHMRVVF